MSFEAWAAWTGATVAAASLGYAMFRDRQHGALLRQALSSWERIAASYENDLSQLRGRVDELQQRFMKGQGLDQARLMMEQQRDARAERDAEWRRLRDIGKTIAWIADRGDD